MECEVDNLVKLHKHVALIHCHNKLSLLQRKMSNVLLAKAYNDLDKLAEHNVAISYLSRKMCFNSNNIAVLKKSLLGLMQKTIEWNLIDHEKGDSWHASTMLASVKIQGPICYYSYSLEMRKLLYHPAMYASINLELQNKFKSSYALALYENCYRYVKVGQVPRLSIATFRHLMGIADSKYARFASLRERVLDVAVKEINSVADIEVAYELSRLNRNIESIKFKVRFKPKKVIISKKDDVTEEESTETEATGLQLQLEQLGLSDLSISKIVSSYDAQYIKDKISYIKDANLNSKIRNIGGYLNKALQDNYRKPQSGILSDNTPAQESDNKPDLYAYIKYLQANKSNIAIKAVLHNISTAKREKIMQEFAAFLKYKQPILLDYYETQGLEHQLVENVFMEYFVRSQPFEVAGILTLQQYHEEIQQ